MNIVTTTIRGALVAVLLGGAVLAGTGSAHAAKDCSIGFMPVKPTVGVGSIIATVRVECDVPPQEHHLHLELQVLVRGEGWQGQRMETFDQIPYPAATFQTKTECVPGMWRELAQAEGSLEGKPFDYVTTSMETSVTAEQCARGRN